MVNRNGNVKHKTKDLVLRKPVQDRHMPITELENDSESIWVKVFANKTSHFVASWYRPPGSTSEEFQLFREQLDYIRTHHKGKKLPSAHVLGDFNFKDIDWPDRLNKSGSTLSQSEGQILIDIMNDHGLEQMVHFPTREKNTLDLILTTLPGQFQDVHSPDKLSDHDIVSGTLKIFTPPPHPIRKPRRKGERCIFIRKVIMNLWEKTHLSLQRKNTSMVTRILIQYRRTLICWRLLFKTWRINISHRKLAGQSLQFPGLHLR